MTSDPHVTLDDVRRAARDAGLAGRPVCVHASLRAFGHVEGGAETIVDGLLAEGCTVMVPAFCWQAYAVSPPAHLRPPRNACDYNAMRDWVGSPHIYTPESTEIDRSMGAVPAAVVRRPGRVRGRHPLNPFAAIGPHARPLIDGQAPLHIYAPLEALAACDGAVVLMGVGLHRMTLIHLAEQMAGRTLFRRWARDAQGTPAMVEIGGCSEGFGNLAPVLDPLARVLHVGASRWQVFHAGDALAAATAAIRATPNITRCGAAHCADCDDAIAGGPVLA